MTPDEMITHAFQSTLDPNDPRGAQVLSDIAKAGHIGETSFVPGDPHQSAFREGKRALALYILGRVGVPMHPGGKSHG